MIMMAQTVLTCTTKLTVPNFGEFYKQQYNLIVMSWKNFEKDNLPSSIELFPVIFDYLEKHHKILDIGCGFGKTCLNLYKKGYKNICGIDINKKGILYARKMMPNGNFKAADASNIPFDDSEFDFLITQAFWTTVVESKRKKIMKEISRVIKKGGFLYTAQFGQTWEDPLYKKRYEEGLEKGYDKGTFESTVNGEIRYTAHHYTKEEIEKLLEEADLKKIYYSKEIFTTQSGNKVNGYVIIAKK
ncbi:methyltransferase domain-containing protein [Candidatus Woesearchaeota archaeon]|nr:methyltransferase domain-containing protein [Candidatus Woesearchaeota archaeon]